MKKQKKSRKADFALKNISEVDDLISIVVEKAHGDYDPGTSKFFGAPTCPDEWLENGFLGDDDFFFCQLNISEFKKYDSSGLLPEKGFIFVFLSKQGESFIPNVRYCEENPQTLIDDFNAGFEDFGDIESEYSIDFNETPDENNASALLIDEGDAVVLLKYDPLDDNMPEFLQDTEKTAFLRLKKSDLLNLDFSNAEFCIE